MIRLASSLVGGVVGLISVSIFAVILRRLAMEKASEAIKALTRLIGIVLGSGMADYAVFEVIMKSNNGLLYYILGLAIVFLPFGFVVFIDWIR